MQYHLDTIPVWEALERDTPCLFCDLKSRLEAAEVERSLGGSVMEPDERIKINHTGVCQRHHHQLLALQNRLGHALITDSHTKEQLLKLQKAKKQAEGLSGGLFGKSADADNLLKAVAQLCEGCVICQAVDGHMQRYLYTFVSLWKTDPAFKAKWSASKGVCLPHASELLRMANSQLGGKPFQAFAVSVLTLALERLEQDEKDLEWFTQKFDYRRSGDPWGNSRDALERTINRLRGRYD